jgi:ASC-1-like (ASCH) protein
MSQWRLKVQEPWYGYLVSGLKPLEGRCFEGDRQRYELGDPVLLVEVTIQGRETGQTHCKTISALHWYPSFRALLETEGVENALPGMEDIEEGLNLYHSFPCFQEMATTHGVVAIHLE